MEHMTEGILLCGYKFNDMLYTELYECLPKGIQMLLTASPRVLMDCQDNDIVCLALPLKVHDLINTLEMMAGTIQRQRRRRRSQPRQRSEEEKKIIDEAKHLLMERNNMTEEEAHRYIQKCSMDSGNTLVESAQMVLTLSKF
jgi:response regulator NasT